MSTYLLPQRMRRSDVAAQSFSSHIENEMKLILAKLKKTSVYLLACLLVSATIPKEDAWAQNPPAPPPASSGSSSSYTGQGAPLSANELQHLVAPIALYPDALVAQVLGAATFPDQVAYADDWLQQNKTLTGSALMQAVDGQPWDPSVKALTQFPSVMDNLAKNIGWTSSFGEAYQDQAADRMTAV